MNRGKIALQVFLLFVVCVLGYALVFRWVEHRRVAKGPWIITFTSETNQPALEVNQKALGIQSVRIIFVGVQATNITEALAFSQARAVPFDLPFGQCVFQDNLFQPGTVAIKAYGHDIQFMPRVLTIDGKEHPWRNDEKIELTLSNNTRTNTIP